MSDVDLTEFFKLSKPKKRPCQVGFAMSQLKPAERKQLEAALAADSGIITTGAVQQWLAARGHEVSSPALTSHRRTKACTCYDA